MPISPELQARLAAIKNKNSQPTPTQSTNPEPIPTPVLETTGSSLIANLQNSYAQHGDSLPESEMVPAEQNDIVPLPAENKTEFERIHGVKEFDISETDSHQLFHLINSPRLAKEFGVSDLEIYSRAYNLEITRISQMDLNQIHERIETLQKLVKANNAMQQACIAMQAKKEKEFRDSLIGLPIDEQERLMRKHEDEKWDREERKKRERDRGKYKTDETGAIVGKKKEIVDEKEKLIRKLVKAGISREDAERMVEK